MQNHLPIERFRRKWRKLRDHPICFFNDSKSSLIRDFGLLSLVIYEFITSSNTFIIAFDRIKTAIFHRSLRLHPAHDVIADSEVCCCSSMSTQFTVSCHPRLPPTQWIIATLSLDESGSPFLPVLGVNFGDGHIAFESVQLHGNKNVHRILLTHDVFGTEKLHFCLTANTDTVSIKHLHIHPVSVWGAITFLTKQKQLPLSNALEIIKDPDLLPHTRLKTRDQLTGYKKAKWREWDFPAFSSFLRDKETNSNYYKLILLLEEKYNLLSDPTTPPDKNAINALDHEINDFHNTIFGSLCDHQDDYKIVVFTCIFNNYDELKNPVSKNINTRYICFTDNPELRSNVWEISVISSPGLNPRRASRLPKILAHKYLPDHDFSIYLDGTLRLENISTKQLISECLGNAEIGIYPHHARICLFEEARYCLIVKKEKNDATTNQIERYKKAGFPEHYGLFENAFIVRKNTSSVRKLNELWWKEYNSGSQRDQLSLMYCLWSANVSVNPIPFGDSFRKSPYTTFHNHEYQPYFLESEYLPNNTATHTTKLDDVTFCFVSSVYNKEASLQRYLESIDRQNWTGHIKVILVDDCSSDNSVNIARTWQNKWMKQQNRDLILIENKNNIGNCGCRNLGLEKASGDAVCIIDADCVINHEFARAHFLALSSGADISIGPMGIELGKRNLLDLEISLATNPSKRLMEMKLQYPNKPNAYINCVTRNFCISKSFLDKLDTPLFNENFSFKNSLTTGFGWEDVDMGARLYKLGAIIHFETEAYSIHLTHPPEVEDKIKALGSARNFRRLIENNIEIAYMFPDWSEVTLQKIENWLSKNGINTNSDISHAKTTLFRINNTSASNAVFRNKNFSN